MDRRNTPLQTALYGLLFVVIVTFLAKARIEPTCSEGFSSRFPPNSRPEPEPKPGPGRRTWSDDIDPPDGWVSVDRRYRGRNGRRRRRNITLPTDGKLRSQRDYDNLLRRQFTDCQKDPGCRYVQFEQRKNPNKIRATHWGRNADFTRDFVRHGTSVAYEPQSK